MAKVSVVIPASNEIYLQQTITELLTKSNDDTEVIAVLDGYWPDKPLEPDPRLVILHKPKGGMRSAINAGIDISKGKYIMKIDAHCNVAPNYDTALPADMEDDWLVIPRRYSLEMADFSVRYERPIVDYEYLCNAYKIMNRDKIPELRAWKWNERTENRVNILIDETMTFQGSCWFANKEEFMKRVGYLNDDPNGYGTFNSEAQELGLKYWLGGGKVMVNKKTWYAHLWKGKPYREKYLELYGKTYARTGHNQRLNGIAYTVDFWMNNRWENRIHDLEWLIDRFKPVPTW